MPIAPPLASPAHLLAAQHHSDCSIAGSLLPYDWFVVTTVTTLIAQIMKPMLGETKLKVTWSLGVFELVWSHGEKATPMSEMSMRM